MESLGDEEADARAGGAPEEVSFNQGREAEEQEPDEEEEEEQTSQEEEKPKGMFMFAKVRAGQEVAASPGSQEASPSKAVPKVRPQSSKAPAQKVNFEINDQDKPHPQGLSTVQQSQDLKLQPQPEPRPPQTHQPSIQSNSAKEHSLQKQSSLPLSHKPPSSAPRS